MKYPITIILLLFILFITSSAYPCTLCYTIDNADLNEVVSDYVYVHENKETICDPEWVDPEDGFTKCPQIPKYTDKQWVREDIRRHVKKQVKRGRQKKTNDANAVTVPDNIIQ